MQGMSKEQFKRKYIDTHTELQCIDHMSKRDMKNISKYKKKVEKDSAEERIDKLSQMLTEAVGCRSDELIDSEALPMKDLLLATLRAHPQRAKIENTGTVNFTFADMMTKANITMNKIDDVDVTEVGDDE